MIKQILFATLSTVSVVALVSYGAVAKLQAATAHQCATQDWPAHQHQAHIDFCKSYGYPTN